MRKLNDARRVRLSSRVPYTRVSVSFSPYGLMTFRYTNRDVRVRSKAGNTSRRFPTAPDEDTFYVKLEKRDTQLTLRAVASVAPLEKTRIMGNLSLARDLYRKLEFARSPWPMCVGLSVDR